MTSEKTKSMKVVYQTNSEEDGQKLQQQQVDQIPKK